MEGTTRGASKVTKTPRLQQILATAAEDAATHGRSYIGVEHVMLAIVGDRDAVPTQVMQAMGLNVDQIAAEITATMQTEGYKTPSRRAHLLDGTVIEP